MAPTLPLAWLGFFVALAFLLPNHYSPWLSFHQEALATVAFLPIVSWSVFYGRHVPRIVFAIILLACTPMLQWVFGLISYVGDAWIHSAFLLGAALILFAGYTVSRQAMDSCSELDVSMRPLWLAFIVAGVVSVGMAAHQWLNLGVSNLFIADLPPGGRPFANLAQPNHLATLLLLASLGVWYGWEKRWLGTISANIAVIFLIVGMVLTGSRSVGLAMTWLVPIVMWSQRQCHMRMRWRYLAALSVIFVILSFSKPLIDGWLIGSDTGAAVDRLGQTHLRLLAWKAFFDAALIEPWFGYGWGQIAQAQFRVALSHPGLTDVFYNTHNLLLDLVVWLGFPMALVVTITLAYWAISNFLRCHDVDVLLPLLIVGVVFGHSMVEFPIAYTYFLFPVSFFMGVVSARFSPHVLAKKNVKLSMLRVPMGLTFLFALTLFVQIFREYLPYEDDWREQQFVLAKISGARTEGTAEVVLLSQLHALMRMQRYVPHEHFLSEDLTWIREATERYPYPAFLFKYATALALSEQPDAAAEQLMRLCAVFSPRTCRQVKSDWAMAATKDSRLAAVNLAPFP